jgi:hypothetical protein
LNGGACVENIVGKAVVGDNFLKTRLHFVVELRERVTKNSLLIDAPRRFGKTSVVKEFIFQEKNRTDNKVNVLFFELEGVESVNKFCHTLFCNLLELDLTKKVIQSSKKLFDGLWNGFAQRIGKLKVFEIEVEVAAITENYDFSQWQQKIEPIIFELNSSDRHTVLIFDEFPDMLLNIKKIESDNYQRITDSLMAWLRSIREKTSPDAKVHFVFCGSINLKETLSDLGISKRINDLESLKIPPMKSDEARTLFHGLMESTGIEIDLPGLEYMIEKATDGPPYYGQMFFKALVDTGECKFCVERIMAIYTTLIRSEHYLDHFDSRLDEYMTNENERSCSKQILKHLCSGSMLEDDIFGHLSESHDVYQHVLNRLIYEGYIMRDHKNPELMRFVSPLMRDWWAYKKGAK